MRRLNTEQRRQNRVSRHARKIFTHMTTLEAITDRRLADMASESFNRAEIFDREERRREKQEPLKAQSSRPAQPPGKTPGWATLPLDKEDADRQLILAAIASIREPSRFKLVYAYGDKVVSIYGPDDELKSTVDYDDVDHACVTRDTIRTVALLNKHWTDPT